MFSTFKKMGRVGNTELKAKMEWYYFMIYELLQITVWKFHDFSITQILREITFWDSVLQNLPF